MKIIFCLLLLVTIAFETEAQQVTDSNSNARSSNQVVYVVGEVSKPAKIPYKKTLSLLEAIRQAGGTIIPEKMSRAIIARRSADCKFYTPISIDLRDILTNKAADIILEANDIIDVKKRKGKHQNKPTPCYQKKSELPKIVRPYLEISVINDDF